MAAVLVGMNVLHAESRSREDSYRGDLPVAPTRTSNLRGSAAPRAKNTFAPRRDVNRIAPSIAWRPRRDRSGRQRR
jgi:hypothetical protein